MKINWKVRFSKDNIEFIIRFVLSIFIPVLVYFGMETKDLTSWGIVWDIFVKFISNPYLIGLSIINGLNILIDPTTKGLGDSERVLKYHVPYKSMKED